MISEPLRMSRTETFMVMNINTVDFLVMKEHSYHLTRELYLKSDNSEYLRKFGKGLRKFMLL